VKKLLWLLAIFIMATAARDVFLYFGPMASAYRTYRDEANARALAEGKPKALGQVEGNLVAVRHRLESAERVGDDRVRLVVVEVLQFQRFSETMSHGNRRVAQTRQYVLMSRIDDEWIVSRVEHDATELTELTDTDFGGE